MTTQKTPNLATAAMLAVRAYSEMIRESDSCMSRIIAAANDCSIEDAKEALQTALINQDEMRKTNKTRDAFRTFARFHSMANNAIGTENYERLAKIACRAHARYARRFNSAPITQPEREAILLANSGCNYQK